MGQALWVVLAVLAGVASCVGDDAGEAGDAQVAGVNGFVPTGGSGGSSGLGDRYARAAVVVGSCIPDDGVNRNSAHLWYGASNARIWGRFADKVECLATRGGGCAAVTACIGWNVSVATGACAGGCSGSTFAQCGDGYRYQVDCSKVGLACDPIAICSESPATACDRETFENSCDADGTPSICDDGAIIHGPDCAALGLACADGSCIGKGEVCVGGARSYQGDVFYDGIECDGATLISCVYGREHRLDCASIAPGFSCQTHEGEAFCGLASECTPAAPAAGNGPDAACDGDAVVFCNAGRRVRVDCTALGFERCELADGAHCAPTFVPSAE